MANGPANIFKWVKQQELLIELEIVDLDLDPSLDPVLACQTQMNV